MLFTHFQLAMPYSLAKIEEAAPATAITCQRACVLNTHPSACELHEHGPIFLFRINTSSTIPVLSMIIPAIRRSVPMDAPMTHITAGSASSVFSAVGMSMTQLKVSAAEPDARSAACSKSE